MPVFRVNKTHDYTVMANYHFRNHEMSLKAMGLLSLMLSLPDNWDYSIQGLIQLTGDGKSTVMNALKELKAFGHLQIKQRLNKNGKFCGYEYLIFEKPCFTDGGFTDSVNTDSVNTDSVNQPQLNTNILSTDKPSTKEESTKELSTKGESGAISIAPTPHRRTTAARFVPPSLNEVKAYCQERNNSVAPEHFIDFYSSKGWMIGKNKMKDWKAAIRNWERREQQKTKNSSSSSSSRKLTLEAEHEAYIERWKNA